MQQIPFRRNARGWFHQNIFDVSSIAFRVVLILNFPTDRALRLRMRAKELGYIANFWLLTRPDAASERLLVDEWLRNFIGKKHKLFERSAA